MPTTRAVQAGEVRDKLGELLNQVYYQNERFEIKRKNKPMAYMVSGDFLDAAQKALDFLIEHDPTAAGSLASSLDKKRQAAFASEAQASQARKGTPPEDGRDDPDHLDRLYQALDRVKGMSTSGEADLSEKIDDILYGNEGTWRGSEREL